MKSCNSVKKLLFSYAFEMCYFLQATTQTINTSSFLIHVLSVLFGFVVVNCYYILGMC